MKLEFFVSGKPYAKQSFRMLKNGAGYQTQNIRNWQKTVGWAAKQEMKEITMEKLAVELVFNLPDKRRVDPDNLAKAVLDGLNGVVWEDDSQIHDLRVIKAYNKAAPGVKVVVTEITEKTVTTVVSGNIPDAQENGL